MKEFYLYKGYEDETIIKSYQANGYVEAANFFRKFVVDQLGKSSLYGFVIRQKEAD